MLTCCVCVASVLPGLIGQNQCEPPTQTVMTHRYVMAAGPGQGSAVEVQVTGARSHD